MSQYGMSVEKAYFANKGTGMTADQAARLNAAQQPTLGGYGSPPRSEEKARSLDDAFQMNADEGVVDAVLGGQSGT